MKYLTPYRIATYLLVLFFLGHTAGGMLAQKSLGPESDAVFAAMKSVRFVFNGATCTWYGFWFGFGLTVSAFLLLSAVISWQLDRVAPASWPVVSVMAWALFASHVCNTVLAWAYFFAGPGVFGTAISLLMAVGAVQKQRARA
jgi:hypothetical protein